MKIDEIKRELRSMMNGVASAAMRNAGMTADYRVNFGVELPRLQTLADEIRASEADEALPALAQSLWKESVRECRILATMLYPHDRFDRELATVWAADIRSVELAQIAALYLFSHIREASSQAFQWIASESEMLQILGYHTLMHIMRRAALSERSVMELCDQASAARQSDNPQLRLAAQRVLERIK